VSPDAGDLEKARAVAASGSIFSRGGAMSVSPNAVNKGYDVVPSPSAKFNTERDISPATEPYR